MWKKSPVSQVNWTEKDESLGPCKDWAERIAGLPLPLSRVCALPTAAVAIVSSDSTKSFHFGW